MLLTRIALISEAVDYETLIELNPRRPDPPMRVKVPPEWMKGTEFYDQQKSAHEKYEEEFAAWRCSPMLPQAEKWLRNALQSLESRGLLQWDRPKPRYDLHPVIRGYAVSSVAADQRGGVAQKVADFFSSKPAPLYDEATSLNDLQAGLQVARSLLYMGGKEEQAVSAVDEFSRAMLFNLEAYAEFLALVRPLFPSGWNSPPVGIEGAQMSRLWNDVAISLDMLGDFSESTTIYQSVLGHDIEIDRLGAVLSGLRNLMAYCESIKRYYPAHQINNLLESATEVWGDQEDLAMSHLWQLSSAVNTGDFPKANGNWKPFDALPHSSNRGIYRPGEGEYWLARLRFHEGRLDEAFIDQLERLTREGNNRSVLRDTYLLRGE